MKLPPITLLTALTLMPLTGVLAAEPSLQKTDLFAAGQDGYSDLAALPNGTILCFYERGSTDGTSSYRTGLLTVARFDEQWVREGN